MIDIHLILSLLPAAWAAVNLGWALFRNQGKDAAIYAIILFALGLVALNLGGALNAWTWKLLTIGVFSGEAVYRLFKGPRWKVPIALILLVAAML